MRLIWYVEKYQSYEREHQITGQAGIDTKLFDNNVKRSLLLGTEMRENVPILQKTEKGDFWL